MDAKSLTRRLVKFYSRFSFYQKRVPEYLCGLASRYAVATMPPEIQRRYPKALFAYALWLSMVWIIDGMVDSKRIRDLSRIRQLIATEEHIDEPTELEVLVDGAFTRYRRLVRPFRLMNPSAYQKTRKWLLRYLDCQGDRPKTLTAYRRHRLKDGGMMCVLWHMVLFSFTRAKKARNAFREVSLIVSYQNDLLSLDRDRRQHTPNLIDYLEGSTIWERFGAALQLLAQLRESLSRRRLSDSIRSLCDQVVDGSHVWALNEERYRVGIRLLECWSTQQRREFYELLTNEENSAEGDPLTTPS